MKKRIVTDLRGLLRALGTTVEELRRDRRYGKAIGSELIVLETHTDSPGAQFHIVDAPPWLAAQDFGPLSPSWIRRANLVASPVGGTSGSERKPRAANKASGSTPTFRAIGSEGDPWPEWIRERTGDSGVYAIKEGGKIVYVGSSRGRLYDTVTRHFQQWRRDKKWWSGSYGAGHDPGMTYARSRCQVAIHVCAHGKELETEAAWIEKYKPRDNLVEHPDGGLEDAPF